MIPLDDTAVRLDGQEAHRHWAVEMQHLNLVRQVFRLQQHDPRPSNLVSVDSQTLQTPVPASLVERYVTDCIQHIQADPVLLVKTQPGFDLSGGVRDLCVSGHHLALECSSKPGSYHGGRFVSHTQDQPLLAKQGPDTYEVKAEVRADLAEAHTFKA